MESPTNSSLEMNLENLDLSAVREYKPTVKSPPLTSAATKPVVPVFKALPKPRGRECNSDEKESSASPLISALSPKNKPLQIYIPSTGSPLIGAIASPLCLEPIAPTANGKVLELKDKVTSCTKSLRFTGIVDVKEAMATLEKHLKEIDLPKEAAIFCVKQSADDYVTGFGQLKSNTAQWFENAADVIAISLSVNPNFHLQMSLDDNLRRSREEQFKLSLQLKHAKEKLAESHKWQHEDRQLRVAAENQLFAFQKTNEQMCRELSRMSGLLQDGGRESVRMQKRLDNAVTQLICLEGDKSRGGGRHQRHKQSGAVRNLRMQMDAMCAHNDVLSHQIRDQREDIGELKAIKRVLTERLIECEDACGNLQQHNELLCRNQQDADQILNRLNDCQNRFSALLKVTPSLSTMYPSPMDSMSDFSIPLMAVLEMDDFLCPPLVFQPPKGTEWVPLGQFSQSSIAAELGEIQPDDAENKQTRKPLAAMGRCDADNIATDAQTAEDNDANALKCFPLKKDGVEETADDKENADKENASPNEMQELNSGASEFVPHKKGKAKGKRQRHARKIGDKENRVRKRSVDERLANYGDCGSFRQVDNGLPYNGAVILPPNSDDKMMRDGFSYFRCEETPFIGRPAFERPAFGYPPFGFLPREYAPYECLPFEHPSAYERAAIYEHPSSFGFLAAEQ